MSKTGELLLGLVFVVVCGFARAESPASLEQLSPVERQQSDFYGAIAGTGPGVTVAWSVASAKLELGGDIELTLTVKNAVNPKELSRPNLAERPEWKELFGGFQDLPGASPGEFRYKLKPRNVGEFELPLPKYRFYNPRLPDGRRFQVAFAESPKVAVVPQVVVRTPTVRIPLDAPAPFFDELPPDGSTASPPPEYWWALLVFGALAPPIWIAVWRWRNPDAAKLARIRRARSVRAALDALLKAERSPDAAATVSKIVLRYLWERWRVPMSAQHEGMGVLHGHAEFLGDERAEPSRVQHAGHPQDAFAREAGSLHRDVAHRVQRVRDDDQDRVR